MTDGNDNPDNQMVLKYHYFVVKIYAVIIIYYTCKTNIVKQHFRRFVKLKQ